MKSEYILLGITLFLVLFLAGCKAKEEQEGYTYPAGELWINRASLLGQDVTVRGYVNVFLSCTDVKCKENEYCNDCDGNLFMNVNGIIWLRLVENNFEEYACRAKGDGKGNYADINCTFLKPKNIYVARGIVEKVNPSAPAKIDNINYYFKVNEILSEEQT